jgi:hypothetical protein
MMGSKDCGQGLSRGSLSTRTDPAYLDELGQWQATQDELAMDSGKGKASQDGITPHPDCANNDKRR